MLVSVVIPTVNEEKNIENCLRSIKNQTYPAEKIEIIVVDKHSTDRTKEIARKFTPLVFEYGSERSAQRNFGISKCRGEYFMFLDADMALSPKVIEECVRKCEKEEDIAALFIPEIVAGDNFFSRVRNFERKFYDATVVDGVRFVKKVNFFRVGAFDEKLYAAEDWDLTRRLKDRGRLEMINAPLYHNEGEMSLMKYLRKKAYYSKNFDIYIKKWGVDDPDVKKQFGFHYRLIGVFFENGKWKRLLAHPILALGMYSLRFLVGLNFLMSKIKK